jgi:hypothetical protein
MRLVIIIIIIITFNLCTQQSSPEFVHHFANVLVLLAQCLLMIPDKPDSTWRRYVTSTAYILLLFCGLMAWCSLGEMIKKNPRKIAYCLYIWTI